MGCFHQLKSEISPCQPWFSVDEADGRQLDIPASFGSTSLAVRIIKFVLTGFVVGTFVSDWIMYDQPSFFMAFFTRWSTLLLSLYQISSLFCSLTGVEQPASSRVSMQVRMTWALFVASVHNSIMASILYWVLVYNSSVSLHFHLVSSHGACLICSMVDGWVINRIPVRLMHWWGMVLPVDLGYSVWTAIHGLLSDIGNPTRSEEDENPDLIYDTLDWEDDFAGTLVLLVLVVFVGAPSFHFIMVMLSLPARRYLSDEKESEMDVEEPSVFTRWAMQ